MKFVQRFKLIHGASGSLKRWILIAIFLTILPVEFDQSLLSLKLAEVLNFTLVASSASAETQKSSAQTTNLALRPDGRSQYYSGRQQIETIQPVQHELSPLWPSMVNAQILFVTEILHLYKDHDIYFLARDSEYLYDMARWFLKEKGQAVDRLHLINVSTYSKKSAHLRGYLAQHGISHESVESGKKMVLVDTGFTGSVINSIRWAVGATDLQIKAHLMMSLNDEIPSSMSFLAKLIENVDRESLSNVQGAIWDYEHLPRAFDRAIDYTLVNGIFEPRESLSHGLDGEVNVPLAQKYRESLKAYLAQGTFEDERLRFERVLKRYLLILQSDLSPKLKKQKIQLILQEVSSEKTWRRRLLRDVLEAYIQAFRVFPGVDHVDFSLEKDFMVEFPKPQQTLSNGPTCPKAFGF